MRNLRDILKESILDDIDTQIEKGDKDIKNEIYSFLKENYFGTFKISDKPNKDGLYEVSSLMNVMVKNKNITSLTNGTFVWTIVEGLFGCSNCTFLKSLEGAPKKVVDTFNCAICTNLTSLEGAPKEVGGDFSCGSCYSLKSLKGAPKEVGGDFNCSNCLSLTSLEGAPKEVGGTFSCATNKSLKSLKYAPEKVKGSFDCSYCNSLDSLKYAPKEVYKDFWCWGCKVDFTKDDVKKVSNVKREINC